jgi:hypothetical protein
MPRRGRGPRLWFQPARRDRNGYLDAGGWTIRDGRIKRRLGLGADADQSTLDDALSDYLNAKRKIPRDRDRDPSQVMIHDVLSIYAEDVGPRQERRKELVARLSRLLDFFGTKRLTSSMRSSAPPMSLRAARPLRHGGNWRTCGLQCVITGRRGFASR